MGLIDRIFGRQPAKLRERQVMCSACFQVAPEPEIFVLPWFNDDVKRFVTTYRCGSCWSASLEQAVATLAASDDPAVIASAAEVFRGHGVFIHEYLRGDPPALVKQMLLQLYEQLRSGALRLKIGQTVPLPD